MTTQQHPPRRHVLEIILIIGIIGIAVITVSPMFLHRRHHQSICTSNIRILTQAVMMYANDNAAHQYPDANWCQQIRKYIRGGDNQTIDYPAMIKCDRIAKTHLIQPITYGYNALLLNPDGTGILDDQVKRPTEVGVFCDVAPYREYTSGGGIVGETGLIYGNATSKARLVAPDGRHDDGGFVIGYVDGHASFIPEKYSPHDRTNGFTRSFRAASGMGFVDNPTAGMPDFVVAHPCATPITIGGDPETATLLQAACSAWGRKASGASYTSTGFHGVKDTKGRSKHYLWGDGSGVKPGGNAVAIANDLVVFIVNRNSRLPQCQRISIPKLGSCYVIDEQELITQLKSLSQTTPVIYSYPAGYGMRTYVERVLSLHIQDAQDSWAGQIATADIDMVDKVAADPKALGYCSLAMVDQKKVAILAIRRNGTVYAIPNTVTDPAMKAWPYQRTLYAVCGGDAWRPATGDGIGNVMLAPGGAGAAALQHGYLFQVSYQLP